MSSKVTVSGHWAEEVAMLYMFWAVVPLAMMDMWLDACAVAQAGEPVIARVAEPPK